MTILPVGVGVGAGTTGEDGRVGVLEAAVEEEAEPPVGLFGCVLVLTVEPDVVPWFCKFSLFSSEIAVEGVDVAAADSPGCPVVIVVVVIEVTVLVVPFSNC